MFDASNDDFSLESEWNPLSSCWNIVDKIKIKFQFVKQFLRRCKTREICDSHKIGVRNCVNVMKYIWFCLPWIIASLCVDFAAGIITHMQAMPFTVWIKCFFERKHLTLGDEFRDKINLQRKTGKGKTRFNSIRDVFHIYFSIFELAISFNTANDFQFFFSISVLNDNLHLQFCLQL